MFWQTLVRIEDLAAILSQLQDKKARAQPFIRLLVSGLCNNPKTSANSKLLTDLIQQTDVGETTSAVEPHCNESIPLYSLACIVS